MGKLDPIRDMFPGIVHDHDLRTIDHLDFDLTCESRHEIIHRSTNEVIGSSKDKCTITAVALMYSCQRPEGFLACGHIANHLKPLCRGCDGSCLVRIPL